MHLKLNNLSIRYWETTQPADPSCLTKDIHHRRGSWQTQDSLPRFTVYGVPKQASILGTRWVCMCAGIDAINLIAATTQALRMELFRKTGFPLPDQHTSDTTPTGPGPAQQGTGLGFTSFDWCDLGLPASSSSAVKGLVISLCSSRNLSGRASTQAG